MSLGATMHRALVTLSDVDRNVYESLDFRLARHPSESVRYLMTRLIAYCLCWEEGIAFSKGGLSSTDEPPLAIHDRTGLLLAWIDIGSPSADRMHRATKAAPRVALFTHAEIENLQKEASSRNVHRVEEIEVWHLEPEFLDALGAKLERNFELELVRTDGRLYVTLDSGPLEGELTRYSLVPTGT